MTCEEVRQLVTDKIPDECTRAERIAVFAHTQGCPKCNGFIMGGNGKKRIGPEEPLDVQIRRAIEDLRDPEVGLPSP